MPTEGYADVNGLRLYYQVRGSGKPLVMLHGGMGAHEMFGENIDRLAARRQVVIMHQQGHGNTRDPGRPMTYEAMGDDAAGLIEHLGFGRADLLGYSLGGEAAVQAAARHPDRVDRLIVVGSTMTSAGMFPEIMAQFREMPANAEAMAAGFMQSPWGQTYPDLDAANLFRKIGGLMSGGFDFTEAVRSIRNHTLLVYADADMVPVEHIAAFYRALGGGLQDPTFDGSRRSSPNQLAIIPGCTHYDIMETTRVADIVDRFLG
jgi:pimeloyl-ACP methyl ester carboxylesterase